jgi:hypothetical protein
MVFFSFLAHTAGLSGNNFSCHFGGSSFFTRPIAIKKFKMGGEKTNVDSLVGKCALVTKKITEFDRGEVKLNGLIWTARTEDGSTFFVLILIISNVRAEKS